MEILDTTLRDGEQTVGVSFLPEEKFSIARFLLEQVKVDAIEVASARISEGERSAVRKICSWAQKNKVLDKIEVLGFVDGVRSAEWINDCGCQVINLLTKGSLRHLEGQLHKTREEHVDDIKQVCDYAARNSMKVNVYLEDWSNGMQHSKEYVFFLVGKLQEFGVNRVMLADTLGVLDYEKTFDYVRELVNMFPKLRFDFHAHNDYEMAVSNSIAAAKAGVIRLHTTINGLGERTGNAKLASLVAALKDFFGKVNVDENKLAEASSLVESFSGMHIAANTPIVGENVFTQNCGVHADGDKKGNLYHNALSPERFGKERRYALGKTSGIASIDQNLDQLQLDISLDREQKKKLLARIKELGDRKHFITREDLPFIIADVIGSPRFKRIELVDYGFELNTGQQPKARIELKIDGVKKLSGSNGDGQYDAFMNAVKKVFSNIPELIDYNVRIPPGGKTSALVETKITWKKDGKIYTTRGVDSDQLLAGIQATMKMLNLNGF